MEMQEAVIGNSREPRLTKRELQIIDNLMHGCANKEIAQHLGVSDQTIKNQLTTLYRKVGVSGRVELVLFAVKRGVTKDQQLVLLSHCSGSRTEVRYRPLSLLSPHD